MPDRHCLNYHFSVLDSTPKLTHTFIGIDDFLEKQPLFVFTLIINRTQLSKERVHLISNQTNDNGNESKLLSTDPKVQ